MNENTLSEEKYQSMLTTARTVPRQKGGARGRAIRQVRLTEEALTKAGYSAEEISAYWNKLLEAKTAALNRDKVA